MLSEIAAIVPRAALASWQILNDVSPWIVLSLAMAGLLHAFLSPERFQRTLGNRKVSSLVKATVSGMLLPICSCGVIPLGLGMYYSGAYLGPTLAFMVATPIINPAAVLLAYGLLGPQIATIYLVSGFVLPLGIGLTANLLAGPELRAPGLDDGSGPVVLEVGEKPGLLRKLLAGLEWGFKELGVMTGKYIIFGIVLAGVIIAAVSPETIQRYLGDPGMVSILGVTVIGAILYVCAVGHIPLVAALVASGAAPGVAITFLMAGAATNLPELISIYRLIGKRAAAIYAVMLTGLAVAVGFLTNRLLLPGFVPFFNLDKGRHLVGMANSLILAVPPPVQSLFSGTVVLLCLYAFWPKIRQWAGRRRGACDGERQEGKLWG